MYAISVQGRIPPSIGRELRNAGIVYRSRDTSKMRTLGEISNCVQLFFLVSGQEAGIMQTVDGIFVLFSLDGVM